jgi:hypothetical protein
MLVKQNIIDKCKSLKFDPDEYCLGYGGALVLYGIKDSTADIDIMVTKPLFDKLSQKYNVDYDTFNEPYIYIDEIVDIFIGEDLDLKTYIEDIPVYTLDAIIESKRRLGRPKDVEDIKRIEEFMGNGKKG